MPNIELDFPIKVSPNRVFRAVSTPKGLDQWWTRASSGTPSLGARYDLDFGPEYRWSAEVTVCEPDRRFELTLTEAHDDWRDTRVGFELTPDESSTAVRFYHLGWPTGNAHYRTSCYCWPMYLRIPRRHLEHGEVVAYEHRLDA